MGKATYASLSINLSKKIRTSHSSGKRERIRLEYVFFLNNKFCSPRHYFRFSFSRCAPDRTLHRAILRRDHPPPPPPANDIYISIKHSFGRWKDSRLFATGEDTFVERIFAAADFERRRTIAGAGGAKKTLHPVIMACGAGHELT